LAQDWQLRDEVQAKLELEWSPEQIAAWLRATYPDRATWHVCHETIYQALYHGGKGGLRRELTRRLRTGRPLRKRRRQSHQRRIRFIAPALLIDHRPLIVEQRSRIGDWEGDLITGRRNQSVIGTLVDRTSRYVKLVHLPAGHSASELRAAMTVGPKVLTTLIRLADLGVPTAQQHVKPSRLEDNALVERDNTLTARLCRAYKVWRTAILIGQPRPSASRNTNMRKRMLPKR
jgi:IS30 family transposase